MTRPELVISARHLLRAAVATCLALAAVAVAGPILASDLELAYVPLTLPGAPAQVLPVEIDGDPGPELAVVVVYTAWDELAVEETSSISDVDGLVSVLTIVPALLERRELWIFDRVPGGSWVALGAPLALATDVATLEATTHPQVPILALTDQGIEAIRWTPDAPEPGLERSLLVAADTVLAGTQAFLPRLRWVYDLDGDEWPDLLLPTLEGWSLIRGTVDGFAAEPTQILAIADFEDIETPWRRDLPLPIVRDVDGDGRPDILSPHPARGWDAFFVYRNRGDHFAPASGRFGGNGRPDDDEASRVVFFDDLDGDGRAEYLTQQTVSAKEAGMKEMAHAKRPPQRYRVLDADDSLAPATQARTEFAADGYSFPGPSDIRLPGGLWDLDGDGRRDLVTLTLDFSVLQAVRVLVAQSLNIGLDFHVLCQRPDGSFRAVRDLDLSGRFRLDLDNFRQGQLSMFGGDFDGDGRRDFVQIGRGRKVSIHRGAPGCRFPAAPDLEIELTEAPEDLALVDVADLDGDGLSDLMVTQLEGRRHDVETPPVRLDLYLSGEPR